MIVRFEMFRILELLLDEINKKTGIANIDIKLLGRFDRKKQELLAKIFVDLVRNYVFKNVIFRIIYLLRGVNTSKSILEINLLLSPKNTALEIFTF